ncbi:MAG TPA: ATP-binding protein [Stellaceae bacterium]|nr:ATP-binding protein [Stellaceae bacterium]
MDKSPEGAGGDLSPAPARPPAAVEMLRLLLFATILFPLILGAVAGYLSYLNSCKYAARSAFEAVAVATENTTKVLDTHLLVAARINDLIGTASDDQIHSAEKQIHDSVAQQISGFPEVAAAWVIDAKGHELVSARVYPVNRDLDNAAREDFKAFRNADVDTYIWMLRARSLETGDFQPYFTVSLRRSDAAGHFNGIVVVAVSGAYFASFYNSLLVGSEHYTASVLRDDGTVLARYPEPANSPVTGQPDPRLAQAIANERKSGIDESGTPFDGGRLIAIKRVANYPIYVTIERTKASILYEWMQSVVGYVLIGVPAAILLFALSLLALRRTRREKVAIERASEAVAKHAALEVELNRVQRLEAVGLLTAGIAHDFNNLLMIVIGNVDRLEDKLENADARQQKLIAAVRQACDRAVGLNKRLMGLARHEPSDPRPIKVNDTVRNTFELPWQLGNRITGELVLQGDLWSASVDAEQLTTALLNLLFNARDAMPNGGKVIVETTNVTLNGAGAAEPADAVTGEYVGIFVTDTGHGMSPEVRDKALDPFFTTKEPDKGTGLGLSMVNAFTTRSGGHCVIESEPGRGTTIKIYLPRYVAAQESERVEATKAAAATGG